MGSLKGQASGCAHIPVKLMFLFQIPLILFIATGLQVYKSPESSEYCAEFYIHSKCNLGKMESLVREKQNQQSIAFIGIITLKQFVSKNAVS